eukprot:536092_1
MGNKYVNPQSDSTAESAPTRNKFKLHIAININPDRFGYFFMSTSDSTIQQLFLHLDGSGAQDAIYNRGKINNIKDEVEIKEYLRHANIDRVKSGTLFVDMFRSFAEQLNPKLVSNEDIQWILLMPAVCSQSTKDITRKWMNMAGLGNDKILDQCIVINEAECLALSLPLVANPKYVTYDWHFLQDSDCMLWILLEEIFSKEWMDEIYSNFTGSNSKNPIENHFTKTLYRSNNASNKLFEMDRSIMKIHTSCIHCLIHIHSDLCKFLQQKCKEAECSPKQQIENFCKSQNLQHFDELACDDCTKSEQKNNESHNLLRWVQWVGKEDEAYIPVHTNQEVDLYDDDLYPEMELIKNSMMEFSINESTSEQKNNELHNLQWVGREDDAYIHTNQKVGQYLSSSIVEAAAYVAMIKNSAIISQGWLEQKDVESYGKYNQRWIVLTDTYLFILKTKQDNIYKTTKYVFLSNVTIMCRQKLVFTINKKYELKTKTESERTVWLNNIKPYTKHINISIVCICNDNRYNTKFDVT